MPVQLINQSSRPLWRQRPATKLNRSAFVFAAGLAAGVLGGCAAPATTPAATRKPMALDPASVTVAESTLDDLKKGMSTEELIARWGQPLARKPLQTSGGNGEVWTYQHVVGKYQRQVSAGTRDVPYVDPITGVEGINREPVYSQENVEVVRTAKLLIFQGQLLEWNVSQAERSSIL